MEVDAQRLGAAAHVADAHGARVGVAAHLAECLHLHRADERDERVCKGVDLLRQEADKNSSTISARMMSWRQCTFSMHL